MQPIPTPSTSGHAVESISADAIVGSPLKKARASVDTAATEGDRYSSTQSLSAALGSVMSTSAPSTIPAVPAVPAIPAESKLKSTAADEEEEL